MQLPERIFRAYDIRGIIGDDLNEKVVRQIGLGYGALMRQEQRKSIAIGHDVRATSPVYARALAEGICSAGLDVVQIGQVATPMLYYSVQHLKLDGGVMVTGSHNPVNYNGLKIVRDIWPIWGDEITRLREIAQIAEPAQKRGTVTERKIGAAYEAELAGKFKLRRGLKVAIDCGNGVAGPIIVPLLKRLGVEIVPLYVEPDGTFPNHLPDPEVPEYMEDLCRLVKSSGADCGLGFDGDADRVGLIDETGAKKSADHVLLVMARYLLEKVPGGKVIFDVKCSDFLLKDIARRGGKPILWKTGHSLIKEKLRLEHAIIAGELSGHICVAHEYYGFDDAFYAALLLLQIMTARASSCSALFADIPKTFYTPEVKLPVDESQKFAVVRALVTSYKREFGGDRVIDLDGVRATWPDGWALIRASNTTANLTARVEAHSEAALQRIASHLLHALKPHPVETDALADWTQPGGPRSPRRTAH
ncbi:MAG: phosphomannomutase/phosphoglucomutase [Planctomycetota bacterium]